MTTNIIYNPTPDPYNSILQKFLESELIVDKFKGEPTWAPFWHDGEWVEVYNEDGSVYRGYWDFGGFQCSDDFLKKLEQHPVIRGNCFTGVWIDDALGVEERLLSKLRETLDKPKKQHKPKHKVPFWVQDWRGG